MIFNLSSLQATVRGLIFTDNTNAVVNNGVIVVRERSSVRNCRFELTNATGINSAIYGVGFVFFVPISPTFFIDIEYNYFNVINHAVRMGEFATGTGAESVNIRNNYITHVNTA